MLTGFTYNIERHSNLRWFTPVAIVGGIIALVFFSLINIASTGYDLTTKYTNEPQSILNEKPWYLSWSWDHHLQPNCSEQNIPVGSQVFTSNLGFTYTLKQVWRNDPINPSNITRFGSLPYYAQNLQNCTVDDVTLQLFKADSSLPYRYGRWFTWDNSHVTSTAHCAISTTEGALNATLAIDYKPGPSSFDFVIRTNYNDTSSIWWGTRLLNLYWYSTLAAMSRQEFAPRNSTNFTTSPPWTKGYMNFAPSGGQDLTQPEFFVPYYYFLAADGTLRNSDMDNLDFPSLTSDPTMIYNNASFFPYSESLTEGLSFARVMYSTLLVDLGSNSSQNVLLDEALLRWILVHPDDTFRNDPNNPLNASRQCEPFDSKDHCYVDYSLISKIAAPNLLHITPDELNKGPSSKLMKESFDAYQPLMGNLSTKSNTTIYFQYSCQIPQRKPFKSIILPLLVADLVFLQACWKILGFIAMWQVKRQDNHAMWCQGCREKVTENMEMTPTRTANSSAYQTGLKKHGSYSSLQSDGSGESTHLPARNYTV